ncbi:hypothetical protein FSP39_006809 [Pinctada imbricata]|uniref:G-protein coupled receptors family 1 profile domain-containing protein n=1 Tax=Pinctada imbricata TaxID=66713 RepID=A0AA89BY68_PINIB|nr:hypothetical protein FSP39_006809 [Pinctada imbricata]
MSLDTFLLGYTFSSLSYILAVIVLVLPHYIGPSLILTRIRFYNMMFTQWTSFTCVWILISAGIERALTSAMPHKDHSGTSRQAWIIVSIVTFISLISALPVLWEYRVVTSDLSPYQSAQTNASNYLIKRPSTAEKSEFHVVYFCYISSLFVYLPYFLAIVTCISLGTNSRRLRLNLRPIYRTTRGVILNRKISEEIAASKLLIIVLIAYVISSAPLTVVNFLANPIIGKVDLNDDVIILVCNVLAVWYHIYYVIQQQLYFCYNKQYRLTMLTWCC